MTRRGLLAMLLGTLAGGLGVSNVSAELSCPMCALGVPAIRCTEAPVAERVGSKPIGSLIISNEAEAGAFLRSMAKATSAATAA